jgi:hypothetical protein
MVAAGYDRFNLAFGHFGVVGQNDLVYSAERSGCQLRKPLIVHRCQGVLKPYDFPGPERRKDSNLPDGGSF